MEEIKNPFETQYTISAKGSKGLKSALFRYPDKDLYWEILAVYSDGKTGRYKAGEMILAMCYVSGDQEIIYEVEYIVKAALIAIEMIEVDFAELKKN